MNQLATPLRTLTSQTLKRKLEKRELCFGLWITLESPSITEIAVHLGVDWICLDAEHGHLDYKELVDHLRAAGRSAVATLVRVPQIEAGFIKRVLDLGADGIIVPQVRTAEEVESAVSYAKYPPRGRRGIGAERATLWGRGLHQVKSANAQTLVIPIIETLEAEKNLDSIMKVPDVDAFFFGPSDYSAASGHPGEWEGPGVAERLLTMKEKLCSGGFSCGIIGTSSTDAQSRIRQGFNMIGLGTDAGLLIRAISSMQAEIVCENDVAAAGVEPFRAKQGTGS